MNTRMGKRLFASALLAATMGFSAAQTMDDLINPPAGEWPQHGRDAVASRFSPLSEINRDNVADMQLVWARDLGFLQSHQGSPSVWNGKMYVTQPSGVVALDATTGDLLWEYERLNPGNVRADQATRGAPVIYEGKVFFVTWYGAAIALDADTGEEVWAVQMTDEELNDGITTNPIVADGKLIMGTAGADSGGGPGQVIAVDVDSGEIEWTFNTVPLDPSDPAYETWTNPPSWEDGIGGGSPWNAGAYDHETGIVVYGVGQPTPWDRVDDRRRDEGDEISQDLYTASFIALDAATGELQWYHQVVPGDEWDMDQHVVPVFADIEFEGEERRVALLATTTGYLVVIDAESGEFLAGHPVADEYTLHLGYEEDGTPIINPDVRYEDEGEYHRLCPALRWAHIAPGAYSPESGLLYRPNQMGCVIMGAMVLPSDWEPGQRAWWSDDMPRDESTWFDYLGALSAIDPVTGEIVWRFESDYAHNHGPVVTAGDLVLTGSTDRRFRAFDAETGEVLFEQVLTAASQAGTITYEVDGKQYVATMVGQATVSGGGSIPDYNGSLDIPAPVTGNVSVFVFALP